MQRVIRSGNRRRLSVTTALTILTICTSAPALGAERWSVRGGTTHITPDIAPNDHRVQLIWSDGESTNIGRTFTYAIDPVGELRVDISGSTGASGLSGLRIEHSDTISLDVPNGMLLMEGFVLRTAEPPKVGLVLASYSNDGVALLTLGDLKLHIDRETDMLFIESGALTMTDALAVELGEPAFAGTTIGTLVLQAFIEWSGGDKPPLRTDDLRTVRDGEVAGVIGPDVIVGVLSGVANYGTVNDIAAFSVGTTSCNKGDEVLLWIAETNQHPVIGQNLYRLKDDRFEQIGLSWLKHGFLALAHDDCGFGCQNPSNGQRLGVGCSDPYGASLNGNQSFLGPRSEINAHTGAYPYSPLLDPDIPTEELVIAERLQVHTSDLDPAVDGGGLYFAEGHYVTPDDAAAGNQDNNASYQPAAVSFNESFTRWDIALTGTTRREQPAVRAWQDVDPEVVETDIRVPDEGLFILAAKAIELGEGFWRYEYALHNLNSDRSAGSFAVPLNPGATTRNIGFHDVDYHSGEPYDGSDWESVRANGFITWSTTDFDVDVDANALRWGTLYNFRFETNVPPGSDVEVTIGLFKPGTPDQVIATTVGPAGEPPVCGDGELQVGEACDPPDGVHCDEFCQWICGDGVVQEGEECDPPNGKTCDDNCVTIYVCGDGVVDPGEECDPPNGETCDDNCVTIYVCGDSVVDPGEECDPPNGETCDDQCIRIPTCGDDIVDPGEDCDPPNGVICDEFCQSISSDQCENATIVCAGEHEGSTVDADSDGSASCGTSSTSRDVWYSYTPTIDGSARIETCGSSFDTVISVHAECPGTRDNQLACNDDICRLQSRIIIDVQAGTTYIIRVSGYSGDRGDFTLTIMGPGCDACTMNTDCPDTGSPCSVNECVDSLCVAMNLTGACDDGNGCTTDDTCVDGVCVGGPLLPCEDPPACTDCNGNGARDDCENLPDCNGNGLPDECEFADCNSNSINDICEIADGSLADCDGGPVGSVEDGATLFASKCFACHGEDGSGGLGPDKRNHSRVELWNMLLPPTLHTGGAHPEYTHQDFADLEAFLSTMGSGGRPDNIPDVCQTLLDCDEDAESDGCELDAGTQVDANYDGIPDECPNDCNDNGVDDAEEIANGTAADCNGNARPDECDIADGLSADVNDNGTPDECEDPFKTTLSIDGASTVAGGVSTTYRAIAQFSDGSFFEVTLQAKWSVDPETAGTIDQLGRLATQVVPCDHLITVRAAFEFEGVMCEASNEVMLTADGTIACDDGDPCTVDQCDQGSCNFVDDLTDSDGDTVRDCEDRCPGFDDRLDCDSDSLPDECELDLNENGFPDDCEQNGDIDHNGRIDLDDYWVLNVCLDLSGPDFVPPFPVCLEVFDFDDDGDVDLRDVEAFANAFADH